jgi:hypothetical protein
MDPSGQTAETPSTQSELGGTSAGLAWQAQKPQGRQTRMTSPHCPWVVRILPKHRRRDKDLVKTHGPQIKEVPKLKKKIMGFQMKHLSKELVGIFLFHVFTQK